MSSVLDTLVWLADVPVRYGYVFTFLAFFGIFGAFILLLATHREVGHSRPGYAVAARLLGRGSGEALAAARARTGLHRATQPRRRGPNVGRIGAWALLVVLAVSGLIGLLSACGVSVTSGYIAEHGTRAEARIDGYWVSFTADDGTEYHLRRPARGGLGAADSWPGENDTVRYLPDHPQAFVVEGD